MARTRLLTGEKFSIMSGDDDKTFEMMTRADIKANGVISVISNVAPAAVEKLTRLLLRGDVGKAEKLRAALDPLFKLVTVKAKSMRKLPNGQTVEVEDKFRNPLGIKVLMNALGMPSGFGRKPLGKMTAAGVNVVRETAKAVWKSHPEILQPVATFYKVDIEERLNVDAWWKFMCYE
jgi:4-hydroxy-tetrahydrodipicolinate synthase